MGCTAPGERMLEFHSDIATQLISYGGGIHIFAVMVQKLLSIW